MRMELLPMSIAPYRATLDSSGKTSVSKRRNDGGQLFRFGPNSSLSRRLHEQEINMDCGAFVGLFYLVLVRAGGCLGLK